MAGSRNLADEWSGTPAQGQSQSHGLLHPHLGEGLWEGVYLVGKMPRWE